MKHSAEREQLLAAIHRSRSDLREGLVEARQAADLSSRVKASVQKNFVCWIGGSLLVGACVASATGSSERQIETADGKLSSVPKRKSSVSAFFKLIRFLFSVSSPILKSLLTKELVSELSKIEWGASGKS